MNTAREKNIAIIFAGGVGKRMGNVGKPKQFLKVQGKPIIIYTLTQFQKHPEIDEIIVVSGEEYVEQTLSLVQEYEISKVNSIVAGGKTSQDSIYNGLCAAAEIGSPESIVLIHDGVRPFVDQQLITRNIACVKAKGNAVTCTKSDITVFYSPDGAKVESVPKRDHAYNALAPQSFFLKDILAAHEQERATNPDYTDVVDACTMFNKQGKTVHLVEGGKENIKITTSQDYYIMLAFLQYFETRDVLGVRDE